MPHKTLANLAWLLFTGLKKEQNNMKAQKPQGTRKFHGRERVGRAYKFAAGMAVKYNIPRYHDVEGKPTLAWKKGNSSIRVSQWDDDTALVRWSIY